VVTKRLSCFTLGSLKRPHHVSPSHISKEKSRLFPPGKISAAGRRARQPCLPPRLRLPPRPASTRTTTSSGTMRPKRSSKPSRPPTPTPLPPPSAAASLTGPPPPAALATEAASFPVDQLHRGLFLPTFPEVYLRSSRLLLPLFLESRVTVLENGGNKRTPDASRFYYSIS
jgi:hypothetical protein